MENRIFMGASKWDAVDFSKIKVSNICIILFAAGIYGYLIFCKLAHVAFCKQTLQLQKMQVTRRTYVGTSIYKNGQNIDHEINTIKQ